MTNLKNSRWFNADIFVPLGVFILYLFSGVLFTSLVPDMMAANGLLYIVFTVFLGTYAIQVTRKEAQIDKTVYRKFSFFGWLMIFVVFFLVYVAAETLGNYLYVLYPVGITSSYADMTGRDLYLYLLVACSIGPICEELLFRKLIFGRFRKRMSFWAAFVWSAGLFTFLHGTVMHIPVTVGLSLFLSVLYEVTGQFRWCMIFHLLFNYMASTYLIAIDTVPAVMIGLYVVVMVVVVLAYIFRDRVFGVWLKAGGMARFESFLDEKRKSLSDQHKKP